MEDDRMLISADEAEGLLNDDESIHNYAQAGSCLIGCDYERAEAIAAFKAAKEIEIAGVQAKAMKHPLAVWGKDGRVTFFEADMAKIEAFEASRLNPQSNTLD